LFEAKSKSIWEGKPPAIFGTKAAAAVAATEELAEFCRRQGIMITAGGDKDREETELENAAFVMARALVSFYTDRGEGAEASKFDFPISYWQRSRDMELLGRAETVRAAVAGLAAGSLATEAEAYGLTAAAVTALKKEWDDYDALVTKPRQVAGDRKVLTEQLRNRFNGVEAKFESLDDLVGQFGTTVEGKEFVAAYRTARMIVDRPGGSNGAEKTPPPQTPA
jgi:hypothetical protein